MYKIVFVLLNIFYLFTILSLIYACDYIYFSYCLHLVSFDMLSDIACLYFICFLLLLACHIALLCFLILLACHIALFAFDIAFMLYSFLLEHVYHCIYVFFYYSFYYLHFAFIQIVMLMQSQHTEISQLLQAIN